VNDYLRTDQYTYLDRSCPMRTDVHSVDDFVEIAFGEHRFGGDTLRLVVNDPDALLRLAETVDEARMKLLQHLRAKAHPDPAMSQVDRSLIGPVSHFR
jgi:hypothetical protein